MQNVNVFDDKYNMASGTFFMYKQVGDSVQGTYVGKKVGTNKFGNEQTSYKILVGGQLILVNEMTTTVDKMLSVTPGQIVGFKYVGDAVSKRTGKPYKVINVFSDKSLVDREWLEHNEEVETQAAFGGPDNDQEFKNTFGSTPQVVKTESPCAPSITVRQPQALEVAPTVDKKALVAELAVKKFGGTEVEALNKAMMETGLVILPINYDKVIELLQ